MGKETIARKDLQKRTPTFWTGVMSLFGIFDTPDFSERKSSGNDMECMRRDWEAIGSDMRRVMTRCEDGVWQRTK